jgi:hypothetical protein
MWRRRALSTESIINSSTLCVFGVAANVEEDTINGVDNKLLNIKLHFKLTGVLFADSQLA